MTRLGAFLQLSRLQYLAGGVFFLLAVSAIGSETAARLARQGSWIALGCVLWVFCHLLGSHVNCLADYELDKAYKAHLPAAVDTLGKRAVSWLVAAESVAAAVIALTFCLHTGNAVPAALFAVGWVLTMAYSVEPVRLKRRGFLSPLALLLVLYGLPVSLGYVSLAQHTDLRVVAYLAAVGAQMFGVIVMNSLEDIFEDRAAGIATPFVRHGLRAVAVVALVSYLAGTAASIAALWALLPKSQLVFLLFAAIVASHAWVLATIAAVLELDATARAAVRRAGKRNPVQFAVLGVTFGLASVMVLVLR
jgi:4-hydroxybenzoate polyprenyltransferase